MSSKTATDITLYTVTTPNGIKASILLEELKLDYKVRAIKMTEHEQKEPWFLEINPNGRIPAMTDTWTDGKAIRIFESGAILQYLVDRYDKDYKVSYPRDTPEYWEMTSWLMWQIGGLGPMQGQSNHFKRMLPAHISQSTRRLYRTMDEALKKNPHRVLVGDRVTIADISAWGWIASHKWAGVDIEEFPSLKTWLYELLKRPGFEAGRNVPTPQTAFEQNKLSEAELDARAAGARGWVQAGMKADAKK
ncbi:hypothetical protein NQ176_g968 [Zarea fungicola]|uniref:Uncharacterized protein n=1 Tax=Zarea fungicola TaxID=93591 RepID=A0ACC1NUS2_9HYPO|nr:hypothetical protein NQ176_g968 [Lecanicillium fungicola]